MDETAFDIDRRELAAASDRFPAHRLPRRRSRPSADLSYLASPAAEFGRHAWDEGGH